MHIARSNQICAALPMPCQDVSCASVDSAMRGRRQQVVDAATANYDSISGSRSPPN